MSQIEKHQATEATESPLPHPLDAGALQCQVSQVGGVFESPTGQILQVISSKIQFDGDLKGEERPQSRFFNDLLGDGESEQLKCPEPHPGWGERGSGSC